MVIYSAWKMTHQLEAVRNLCNNPYYLGFLLGWLFTSVAYYLIYSIPSSASNKSNLIACVKTLIEQNNGIVTATDLVLMAKVSPNKAQRFLSELASELQVEAGFDEETASKFYRFVGAKQIAQCELRQELNL